MNKYNNPLLSLYHKNEMQNGLSALSEATCEDLNVEDLFIRTDYTSSCVGRQYLYHLLHTDQVSEVAQHEKLIQQLTDDKALQNTLMNRLKKLNHADAFSIASFFIDQGTEISKKEQRLIYYCRFLPFLLLGLTLILQSPVFLLLFIPSIILNGVLHYKNKYKIQSYFFSIPQLILLLKQAELLASDNPFTSIQTNIKECLNEVAVLKKKLMIFKLSIRLENEIAIVAYLMAELLHIFFLTEAYAVSTAFMLLKNKKECLKKIYCFVGLLDTLNSISLFRQSLPHFCTPSPSAANEWSIEARSVYHPLINNAVANNLHLEKKSVLITGSNISGKTSFIRTIGVNLLMAKSLNTCCARHFEMQIDRKLCSAIHITDDLTKGESYYLKEVACMKELLEKSERGNALFLLDEIFKGTNTIERIAIAKAVLSALSQHGNIVLAATHDLELAALLDKEYELYHFSEVIQNNCLSFNYLLKKGVATERNAIRLLELYQYPQEVVREAYRLCKDHTSNASFSCL